MLDILMSEELWELLLISVTFSVFLMAFVQKIKKSNIFHYKWQIWLLNIISAFGIGIPFTMMFYGKSWIESIWVSVFGFIGAPSLYEALKNQNMITYKPKSSGITTDNKDQISIPKENEILREDLK